MSRQGLMRDTNGDGQQRDSVGTTSIQQQHYGYENGFRKPRGARCSRNEGGGDGEGRPDKVYACMHSGCARTFSSNFKLSRHLLIHSGDRRFQCTSCDRRFHRKDHLKNHLQVHNPNKILHKCDKCQKTYCSPMSYRKHIALHAAESGDLVCRICGMLQPDREAILCHLKVHTNSRTLRGPSERKYPCKLCDRSFFTKKDVKRHLVVHTGKRDFVCKFCPQRFGRKDHLVRHTKKSHNGHSICTPPSNDSVRKYEAQQQQQQMSSQQQQTPNDHKMVVSSTQMNDMNGLMMLDQPSVLDPVVKPDPGYGVPHHPANLIQSGYALSPLSTGGENGQLGRFSSESSISQYLPMSPSYPTPIMSHHYLNMSTSSNILSDLLPPMSMAPSFTTLSLDVGNPPLPHFNQAFQ
ncbi:hypothetical protein JTE90_019114 [Oedothorax gibbosus]|uniref:C2H2-type domain-containing protein n=1 Tax=Oedothorax gibbosus TaxID=931172 RepID=A0AAV6VAV4_9ARAC|nr:hypothetical protein JTE90_019114 [Oedothorax gibbosus]